MSKLPATDVIHIRSHMGTAVRVTAIFAEPAEANAYMEANPDQGVIAEAAGFVWIANISDLGYPVTPD